MKVYHFNKEEHGLNNLENKRLKIALIDKLNDPFEFLGMDLSNHEFRQGMEKTMQDNSKSWGILCFSKCWDNPLMWSHYTDGHEGLCLGFEFHDSKNLLQIDYRDTRLPSEELEAIIDADGETLESEMYSYIGDNPSPEEFEAKQANYLKNVASHRLWELTESNSKGQEIMIKLMTTKFSSWNYEQEYRAFVKLDNKESDGNYYKNFGGELILREVIVGIRSVLTRKDVVSAIGNLSHKINIFKAYAHNRQFLINRSYARK